MKKEKILELVKNDPFYSMMYTKDKDGNPIPYVQYVDENYYPIYLDTCTDKTQIDEFWFPDRNRDAVTGECFSLYPSLLAWPPEGLKIDGGEPIDIELFEVFQWGCGRTGAGLVSYSRK